MERRCTALASAPQKLFSRPHTETPFDGASEEQLPPNALRDEDARERGRQAEDAAEHDRPSRRILHLIQLRVGPPRQSNCSSFATSPS